MVSRELSHTAGDLEGAKSPLPEHDHFTIVFKGNLRDIVGNPFLTKTPFGLPRVVGVGNAFEEFDEFCATRDDLLSVAKMMLKTDDEWKALSMDERSRVEAVIARAEGRS